MKFPHRAAPFHFRRKRTALTLLEQENTFPNVRKVGIRHSLTGDLYHRMLAIRWPGFFMIMGVIYILLNMLFGAAYWLLPSGSVSGLTRHTYLGYFFFSVQTLSTVGYGVSAPVSIAANLVMTFEELTGMMFTALATGLVFARFSRPTPWVIFSRNVVIWEENGIYRMALRIGNLRSTPLIDATAVVVLARTVTEKNGQRGLEVENLVLEHAQVPLFRVSLPVVHDIMPGSPLYGLTIEQLKAQDAEIIVTLTATDEVSAQSVFACHTYGPGALRENVVFRDIIKSLPSGRLVADFKLFDALVPVETARQAFEAQTAGKTASKAPTKITADVKDAP
ncbi:ATP-sensitive potassium channel protein [Oecophyllibacter saccharovorans]|uniref:ion channel n=1 Tax=Oecophyllibacter saccharovorans TaxID=2558360 RepID=UPI001142F8AA|nr:ion channel [Oecophyllibacter saccharovorans]QDH15636.1 ATP-sensitive potassium channel protein [Oecophyllibacter saccharovorans]